MKLTFVYDRSYDTTCVLTYGKTSLNSPTQTKIYEELVKVYGDNPSKEDADMFIDSYISNNNLDLSQITQDLQKKWDEISFEYIRRANAIFGITLPHDITAYITINDRCPYSIEDNMFYVSTAYPNAINKTVMHELWHFYTWFKYGAEWEKKLGAQKYNELKEALTALLNIECKDLLPEGIIDRGYPQHQELRQKILDIWSKKRDMDNLWQSLVEEKF